MNRMARSIIALVVSFALVPLLAGVALAGGWAQVVTIDGGGDPPTAGEPLEYRFRLLQHGVTPVDWGSVQLTATPAGGGETVIAEARPVGDGEWVAQLTLPMDGQWRLAVSHVDLETSAVAPLAVARQAAAAAAAGGTGVAGLLPLLLALVALGVMATAGLTGLLMARAARRAESAMKVRAT
jgi:hypothetical protein